MNLGIMSLIIALLIFMWLVSSWEFLNMLSWGRARKIDSTDKELSDIMEKWLENKQPLNVTLKILIFTIVVYISIYSVQLCDTHSISFFGLDSSCFASHWGCNCSNNTFKI